MPTRPEKARLDAIDRRRGLAVLLPSWLRAHGPRLAETWRRASGGLTLPEGA